MTTAIPLTLHLLVMIGLYDLAAGIAGLTRRIDWTEMLDEFERSLTLSYLAGFMAFAIGGVMLINHNHWTDLLAGIVTLVAWIALIEGLLLMILARPILDFFRPIIVNQRAVSLVAALFGLILILLGLTGHADPTAS